MAGQHEPLLSIDTIATVLVNLETPLKVLAMFVLLMYILWFWKVGTYDAIMQTVQAIQNGVKMVAIWSYLGVTWVLVSVIRMFRVVLATVRDFFISRI
ncbi:MAG: hypothetical protein GC134_07300 [Proteobacteria bacterium]|nr:hypothetical protein [Pseudomonadota bacterium]